MKMRLSSNVPPERLEPQEREGRARPSVLGERQEVPEARQAPERR